MDVQVNANPVLDTKKVWYAGTDQLKVGDCLAYDVAATVGTASDKTLRGRQVVKPATANLFAFAGVVNTQPITVGPCFVDIDTPQKGEHCLANCKINATAYSSALGLVDASYALGTFADATLNLGLVAIAAETADTSATAAVKLIKFA